MRYFLALTGKLRYEKKFSDRACFMCRAGNMIIMIGFSLMLFKYKMDSNNAFSFN